MVVKKESSRDWNEIRAKFEREIKEAEENGKDLWKLERFPEYFREFKSSGVPFPEFDARYSLIRELG